MLATSAGVDTYDAQLDELSLEAMDRQAAPGASLPEAPRRDPAGRAPACRPHHDYYAGIVRELRAKAERELGDKFDLRRFHGAVLEQGAVPLDALEAQIDAWIIAERSRS